MSRGVALTAGQPENNSAPVDMAEDTDKGKCIPLSALLVARIARYLSSPAMGGLCTAQYATPLPSGRQRNSRPFLVRDCFKELHR
jgi:hypothetical protein